MSARSSSLSGSRPNIVFILADDLSYRDLGCFGQLHIQTPTLDRLCGEGLRFDEAYAGSPECGPSRGSVMTGMHMGHCRIRCNDSARGQDHLEAGDRTMAEVLRDAGYATGMVGKWGIGLPGTPGTPEKKGFDYSYGFYDQARAHTYYPHYLYENGAAVPIPENYGFDMDHAYKHTRDPVGHAHSYDAEGRLLPRGVPDPRAAKNSEDLCYERALGFIDEHAEEPFFLYYATQLPHGPVITPELGAYKDRDWPIQNREWAAMVGHLDRHVAGLLERLDAHGVRDNTLIVFASDNGYAHWGYMGRPKWADDPIFRNKGPWYGGKFSAYEGGLRVPMFANWPGRVASGCSSQTVALYDLLATFADLAGTDPGETDGLSIAPTLAGEPAAQVQHPYFYWSSGTHTPCAQAVRLEHWFAYRDHASAPIGLWDTRRDVASEHDLAADHADVVARVAAIMAEAHTDSPWYRNPQDDDATWAAKRQRVGLTMPSTRANTTFCDSLDGPPTIHVAVDPDIPL